MRADLVGQRHRLVEPRRGGRGVGVVDRRCRRRRRRRRWQRRRRRRLAAALDDARRVEDDHFGFVEFAADAVVRQTHDADEALDADARRRRQTRVVRRRLARLEGDAQFGRLGA